jgi:curved DNA-binding protein CbpA
MSLSVNDYIKYDLYNIFLLTRENFNLSLLRKAYQRQILIYHPDKFDANISDEEKKEKYETFNLINNAYTILTNDKLREEYNESKIKFDLENTNFIDLKTQFKQQKKPLLQPDVFVENTFKQKMDEMNKNIENNIKNNINKKSDLEELRNSRIQSEDEIKEYYKSNKEDFDFNLLKTEKITPSHNFTSELSNISNTRNIKVENNGSELYNGLYANIKDDKYASLEEAFN